MVLSAPASKNGYGHHPEEICEVMPDWHTVQLAIMDTRRVFLPQQHDISARMELEEELLPPNEGQKGEENGVEGNPFLRVFEGEDWVPEPLLVLKGSRWKKSFQLAFHRTSNRESSGDSEVVVAVAREFRHADSEELWLHDEATYYFGNDRESVVPIEAARAYRTFDREVLWIQDEATYYFSKVLQNLPGYLSTFDVKARNHGPQKLDCRNIWYDQPETTSPFQKGSAELQIPRNHSRQVSALVAETSPAGLLNEGVPINLDNVRKRLFEDSATAVLQGVNSFVYPVKCGFARRLLYSGLGQVFSAVGIHRMSVQNNSAYFRDNLGLGCGSGYLSSRFHTRIRTTSQLGVHPANRIVEPDGSRQSQLVLLHDPDEL